MQGFVPGCTNLSGHIFPSYCGLLEYIAGTSYTDTNNKSKKNEESGACAKVLKYSQ